jgi:hypothetical protein
MLKGQGPKGKMISMKPLLLIAVFILAGGLSGYSQAQDTNALPRNFYKHFSGTIAGQPVSVQLQCADSSISGSYEYLKHEEDIDLAYHADSSLSGVLFFSEGVNDDGGYAGIPVWKCRYQHGRLTGTWFSADRRRTYSIRLEEDYPEGVMRFNFMHYDTTAAASPGDTSSPSCEIQGSFPVAAGNDDKAHWLNKQIKKIMELDTALSFEQALKEQNAAYINGYRKEMAFDTADRNNAMAQWQSNNDISIRYNANGYVVLESNGYDYSGGAHIMPWVMDYCFDMKNKKKMKVGNVVTADSVMLQHLLEAQFREDNNLKPTDSLNTLLFNNYLPANTNFSFNRSGIIFTYNPYEVASYAAGIFAILIPFDRLKRYIVQDFAYRMKLSTVQ